MNIIFVFDSTYPYYTGGIETWIYNVCERLIERHNITIFTVKKWKKDSSMGQFENINPKIKIIPVKNLNHVAIVRHLIHKHIALINSDVTVGQMYKEILKYIDESSNYYVIGLGTVFAAKTVRMIMRKCDNVIGIASCRSLHPEVLAKENPGVGLIVKKMEKKNLKAMDAIWTNGIDTQEALRKKGFESRVIKNGVDYKKLNDEVAYDYRELNLENEIIIATIGTVSRIKGYYEIIDAVRILRDKYNRIVHFVGIGKVNERNKKKFYNYAVKKGVEAQIHLIGEHRNVVSYAKSATVIIGASGGGGYSMAILESMVSQTPIVAWNTPVYQQLLKDEESAKLVIPWDAFDLAKGVEYVINNEKKIFEWGERANQTAKQFDWTIVVEEIETALRDVQHKRE